MRNQGALRRNSWYPPRPRSRHESCRHDPVRVALTAATPLAGAGAGPGPARIPTAPANCTITGTPGNDLLRGTPRNDVICGLAGNDTLIGAGGDDRLMGGSGKDTLDGGNGRDALTGGSGADRLTGGPGADVCAGDPADTRTDPCVIDTEGPSLGPVTVPAVVTSGSTLTITWAASDPAGVNNTNLFLGGPSGYVRWCEFGQYGVLVSGDVFAGTYTASCAVPADAVNATYSVFLTASDTFGNTTSSDGTEFQITGGSDDSAAPVVSALVVPPSVQPGDTIVLQWRATDETGVDQTFPWIAGSDGNLIGPDGVFYGTPLANSATLVSGDATDGVYETAVAISPSIPDGEYIVRFTARDILGNSTYEPYLDDNGQQVGFTIS